MIFVATEIKQEEKTILVTHCDNCGCELDEVYESDGQGEIWCQLCIEQIEDNNL